MCASTPVQRGTHFFILESKYTVRESYCGISKADMFEKYTLDYEILAIRMNSFL